MVQSESLNLKTVQTIVGDEWLVGKHRDARVGIPARALRFCLVNREVTLYDVDWLLLMA